MQNLTIRSFQPEDEEAVIGLWNQCGLIVPQNNPQKDIARKMKVNPELFLVGLYRSNLIATCMAGYEGHRGWINYLAVAPAMRRKGIATRLMAAAQSAGHPVRPLSILPGRLHASPDAVVESLQWALTAATEQR